MPKMINDLLELVLDPYFTPVNKLPLRKQPNQFEALYIEKRKINLRRSFQIPVCPMIAIKYDFPKRINNLEARKVKTVSKNPEKVNKRKRCYDLNRLIIKDNNKECSNPKSISYILDNTRVLLLLL